MARLTSSKELRLFAKTVVILLFLSFQLTQVKGQATHVTGIPADHTFCLVGAPVTLEGFNPGGKVFAGPGITDNGDGTATFDPSAAGLGTHTITYDGARWSTTVTVEEGPVVTLTPFASVCADEPAFELTGGSPAGGTYTGTGVDGAGFFDPAAAGPGTHEITYTNTAGTCSSSAVETITVFALPVVTLAAFPDVCETDAAFALSGGSPGGGTYSGPGVDGSGNFDPSIAGVGTHTITYTYSDGNCTNTATSSLTVNAIPTASFAGLAAKYCTSDAPVNLTGTPTDANGVFSGPGIFDNNDGTAVFDPATAGLGTHTISYIYTNADGCSDTYTQDVQVGTEITMSGLPASYCIDEPDVNLISSPAGGTYTPMAALTDHGDGTATFDLSVAGVGTHNIEYTYVDAIGCINVSSNTITVNPLPTPTFVGLPATICLNEAPVTLTGNYAGGSFLGLGIFDNGDGTATFDPASAGVGGPYDITYQYTDANGCTASIINQVTVQALPSANISGDATICEGNATPIDIALTGAAPYDFTYTDGTNNYTETNYAAANYTTNLSPVADQVYTVSDVTDANGCTTAGTGSATITVNPQVNITTQPTNKNVCPGGNTNFQVVANGVDLTYQWQKDGANIAGATNPVLALNNVDATDVASYQCIVSSATCGAPETSTAATLNLYSPTAITTQPTDDYLCTGEDLQLVVAATGSNLTYQWQKDGVSIADGGDISGATTNTLIISNVTTAEAGDYTCIVTGECGTLISGIAQVTIDAPIVITSQPTSKTLCPGVNASFSTTATGTNLTFQWYKDGAAIAGETSQSLILNTIDATDAADYSCQISSSCGATLSTNTVALNINSETQIITQPATTTECLGANASFEVDAQGTSLTYQWYKDGAAMADGGDIAGATSSQLIISNVDLTDEADYTCDVMGSCGMETTLPAQLIVDDNITVTTQPVSQTLCEGNNASFSVVASGSGLTYQWQKDGVDIAGATNNFINLPNVTDADEGNYRCVISNACGQVVNSSAATLVVNDLTIITKQPSDLWECEGTNVNFTIAADGSNVNYQWFKDGAPLANGGNISGANSANLAVNSITAADEGEYYCEATGDCGIDVSDRAELFVDNNISITQQPASQLVCGGDNITVEVVATGANLTYQWQKDGVDIAGATLAQLSLNAVTAADEADYRCVIENTCGIQLISQAATISLYEPAVITTQPADAVLCEGEEANFSVTATGPSLTYQWFKDGTALADGADITGSTTSTLTLTNITLAENGVYSCQITAPCNTIITDPATLTVQENTQITTQPTNKNYCQGENGQFSVQATGSNLTYQWQKDGVDIPGETNSGISIANVSIADEGVYRCVVSGDCGTITSNGAQLTLNTPVTITTDPANLVVCEDQTADFSVTASGTGLTYQWRKDGVDLTDNASISGSTSANLSIDPVVLVDGGVYTCVVTGTCDQAVSSPASLTVNEEVTITQQPTNKQSCEGDDVTFSVLATGTNITYQWQKDGVDIAGENASSLQLTNVVPADDGVYRCVLTGTCNTIASDGVSLTLGESTQITTNPTPKTLCEGLTANFSVVASGSNLTYQWKQDGVNLTNSATISGANSPDLSISNISTANAGVYTCEVVGDCGTQNSSPANLIVNEGTVITDHPDNLTACPGEDANFSVTATGTSLTYQWQLDGVDIPGETSSGLTVTNVSDADEGVYRCVITNSCGTVNSNGASLVVDEAVNIVTQPVANTAVCEGDNLTLNVATTGTSVTYQWQKDGSNLSDGGNISGATSQNLNINNATVVDDAIYNVVITGSCATITSDFSDVVINPTTSITQQPANYTAVAGGTATFSVEAEGDNLTYQWQKDGADLSDGGIISGANTPDLTLTGVAETDEGAYRCVVTGTCNTANSSPANLVVNPTTVITTQPTSKVKCEGESANFSVTTDGTGFTFQWKKDGVNLADNANISGATTANLSINATSLSDAGAYTCEVSGENSAPAILEVHENTIVTTQPTAKTRCVGDNLVFSIEASGHNLTYQWQKDGVNLSDGGTLSGATTETLTISAVDLTDMGDYTCVVTGSCGTANSDPAALVVYENTTITTQPAGATICEQGSHTFSMVTTGDNLSYSWTKDGSPVTDGGNISGATTANLVISNATLSDAGAYVGTVAGNCGSETSVIAQLEVQPATAITLQPVDFTGCEGESVTLSVLADGTALNFQWQKDGVDVSDGAILSGTTTPNLTLAGLTAAEAGTYVCVVTGACGTQNSQPAEVAIYNQTQITTQPTGTVVCQGDAVSLSVQADGSNLSYQWKKGANNVVNDANISGANTANLTIASAELTDAGAYYCVVTGSCGEENSDLANVDVEKQTLVLTQPADVYSCNAKDVSFIMDATGENLNYQWQKDGVDLTDNATVSGSNTPLLELSTITSAEAGDYRCVISGNCGTVNSDPAQLVVYNTVQITSQPSDKTLCEGEQISLNLTATGDNLTYQWKRDGVALSDGGDISGTQTPNLIINNATIAESGTYTCQVNASCGTEYSLPVAVSVDPGTVITQQPTGKTACEGENIKIEVVATGANLTYQWQKDGVDIAGATLAQLSLNSVTAADEADYRCVIENTCGIQLISQAATISLYEPAVITTQPADAVLCEGEEANFSVTATGPSLTYQWFKDGTAIADGADITGSTTSTLTLTNITLAENGVYSCQITAPCNTIITDPATLTVQENTQITTQPTNKNYCQGENGQFSVQATGSNLTYQWQKDGVDIPGETNSGISIANVSIADEGVYRCVVAGDCGTITSNGAQLTRNTAVTITTDPANQVVCEDQTADFSVTASGTGLTYQWRKDGVDLSDNAAISGSTSANLSINPVVLADGGVYTCVVTGTCDQAVSSPASLTVNELVTISQQPTNKQSCEGDDVTFSVLATGTNITYQWQKDGVDIAGENASSLQLTNVVPADDGVYRCVLTGTCNTIASDGVSLTLGESTQITTNPTPKTLCEGLTANFSVVASGSNLTYQWKQDGVNLTNSATISGANSPDLSISNISTANAGVYTCEVVGDCGTQNSSPANLTINQGTVITDHPDNLTACPGEDANFSVTATGTSLTYQWQLDGVDIPGETSSGLTVTNVSDADEGVYRCVITNSCGTVNSNGASLVVDEAVNIITQPVANVAVCEGDNLTLNVATTGTSVTYQWQKDGSNLSDGGNISGATSQNLNINNATVVDDGIYNVVITGSCATITSDFSDVVINPTTSITQQPANYTAVAGGTATFSVEAEGDNLTYQWQKDGADLSDGGIISGANTPDLTLTGVAETDEGAYRCVVTGTCNTANSSPANLVVNPTTVITTQPTSKVKCEGESANFSVTTDGTGFTFQWKKDGVNLADNANISGATTANLAINATSLSDAGAYTCEVSGENSAPAILEVHENTIVTTQPTAKTRCVGDNLVFSIEASGHNLTYQWQKDGVNLSDGGTLSGATTETLTISAVDLTDMGDYTCVVTGSCGTANSDPAALVVYENTTITTQPAGATICEQGSHTFSMGTTGDNLIYNWTKDGSPVTDGGNISGATTANLVISNATLSDAGAYVGTVAGNCGSETSVIAQLEVQPATAITLQPVDFTGCEGESVTLSVLADGTALNFQWQKDGVDVSDGAILSGTTTPNLTLAGLTAAEAGTYVCVVTGACGTQNSQPAEVAIYNQTQITTQPTGTVVCQGDAVSLSVQADGSNLSYQWKKGANNVVNDANISGANTANLTIASAGLTDAGAYYCVVTGSCGEENSDLANVDVEKQTQVLTQPADVYSCNAKDVSFIVDATGENLNYQWQKDGVDLTDNATVSGSNTPLLELSTITSAEAGDYRCVISGNCGTINSDPAQLVVYNTVQIISQPSDKTLCEGEQISLNLTATGDNLTYQWKRDGVALSDGGDISGTQTPNLIINNATIAESGIYSCQVSASCGTENSLPVAVSVAPATVITQQPTSKATCEVDLAVFTVEATGQNLTYQWQKDGVDLSDGGAIFGTNSTQLTISNLTNSDAGAYRCIITGDCGTINSDAADLAVGVYPDAAGNVDGPSDICQGAQGILYEVPAINSAVTYQWNLPVGVTILSGAGTRAIEVYFEDNELGGDITVQGVNSCGIGPESPVLLVTAHPKPEANAGPDQSLCINTTTLAATDPGTATGTWSVLNGPALVQDVHAFNSQVDNLREGINTFIWTVEESGCSSTDTVIITNNHISVNAGIDETICAESITMQGSSIPDGAVGSWSVLSGSANFTDGNDPLTEATDFATGSNELQWTVTKGGCSFSDQVIIDNQRPTEAYAGIKQSVCRDSTNLSANEALTGTGSWSVVAGSATFVDGTDPNTKVTGLGQGDNILRWTISNGICSTIDQVTITNNQLNPDGGTDQVICSRTTTLEAQAPTTGIGNWSVFEGAATFVNNNQHNTVVTGLAKGENVLIWNINNNGCISSDTVSITNDSPTEANAGPDQTLTEDFTTLQANIPAVGTGEWSLLSGSADIADATLFNTNVTNLALGENIFRWTITHNSCISYDDVIINNYMSTQTDAGADQTLCGETTTLDGNEPNFGFGEWSVIQGAATFTDNSNPKTEVSGLAKGENILRWSVWENGWTHDDVVITNDAPTDANAGVDQLLCADNTTLAGNEPIIGNGQWTVISGSGTFTDDMSYNTQVTDLAKGENIFKWTITNKSCSSSDLVKIINQSPTTADAGEDITTCVDTVVLSPNTPSVGTASWSIMSGSANFDGNIARNLATGPNTLRYTIENDGCISFDDVVVTNNEPSDANAGANKVICVDSIYLSASTPVVGQGTWTIQSGSATIEDPTNPNTQVTQLNQGINVFRWTVEYNGCTKYDEVTIKNSLVVAEAGVDQTVCSESTVLEANNPSAGTGSWSVLGGSGSATFEAIDQPDTRVTGLDQGTNILRWTITNDICTSFDEVSITNDLPSEAFAGPDQALCTNEAQLQANAPLIGTGQWTVLSGSATIADPTDPNTTVTNLSYGVNTLRWTITSGACTSTDEVVLTNNGTEVSDAGIDQTLCVDSTLLYANNPSFGEGQWSVVSGSATFADNSNHQTQVNDLGKGENVLRWSISNGTCASTDDVIVTNNSPTTAIAGADQTICGDQTYLQANTPAIGTGSWSLVSGAAIFTNASQNNTQVTDLNPGSNTLRWTIESNGCISQDQVTIFNDLPFEADAGEDFAICGDSAPLYANDPGTGTGQWMVISGAGTFDDPSNFNATVTDLGFGANTLRWTITNDQCTTYDEIVVTNNSIDVNAGPDQIVNESSTLLVASNPSAGTGQWSVIGGSGSFDDATNPITEVRGLGAGLNTYRWSVDVNGCISYDDVSVTYNVPPTASFVISKSAGCPPLEVYFVNNSLDNLQFSWDFDDGTTSQQVTVKHTYETPGIYRPSITVLAPNGEQVTKDTLITVHEQPEASFMVVDKEVYIPDEQATFISTSSDAVRYLWEFGDNETSEEQDPKHTYETAGIYDVGLHIWSEYNCYDSIQMKNALEVFESGALEFPNAFTPNPEGPSYGYYNPDDFSNDVFFPIGEGVDEYHLEIFNKWGILVFESFDINIGWDGYRDEELMEEGVYVYKVSGTYNNGKPFKQVGTVLLLRQ